MIAALIADGHAVTVLTRAQLVQRVTPEGLLHYVHWDLITSDGGLADVLAISRFGSSGWERSSAMPDVSRCAERGRRVGFPSEVETEKR